MSLAGRTILARGPEIVIAEPLDGEVTVADADERPAPFRIDTFAAALLDAATGELLGTARWRPVPGGPTPSWDLRIELPPMVRSGHLGGAAARLLSGFLFDTTGVDRVQATVEVADVGGWRALELAGFRREGALRGGRRRDMLIYGLLRSDLERANGSRRILARRDGVILAEACPEDAGAVAARSDDAFVLDPDPRLSPVLPPPVFRGAVLDEHLRLLGTVSWHAVDYGGTLGCSAWNIGITLVPDARGRGVGSTAQRLLAEHLFATTELDRVEAGTDLANLAEQRALEKAGFRREGVLRGAQVRGGRRRNMVIYGLLRTDIRD